MENSILSESEGKLFDLLDRRNFDELTREEKNFVLQLLSEEEYTMRRNVILESKDVFDTNVVSIPGPLIFSGHGQAVTRNKEILFYRMALSVAALVILFLLLVPYVDETTHRVNGDTIVQRDTLMIETKIRDTVYLEKVITKEVTKKVYVEETASEDHAGDELRLLETGPVRPMDIENVLTKKTGTALNQDEINFLVTDLNLAGDLIGR